MVLLDLELLILTYVGFGTFLTFYNFNPIKIKRCYKVLPKLLDSIKVGDIVGTNYLLGLNKDKIRFAIYKTIEYGQKLILENILAKYEVDVALKHAMIHRALHFQKTEILEYLIQKYNYIFIDPDFGVAIDTENLDILKLVIRKFPDRFDWIAELALRKDPELQIFEYAVSIGIKLTEKGIAIAEYYEKTEIAKYIRSQMQ